MQHTETLKLLFVLYFSILKNPRPTPLLPAALRGIAKFAHLVNIDFFKDLLQVLKTLMTRDADGDLVDGDTNAPAPGPHDASNIATVQHQLLCIVTAFELLSGQGTHGSVRVCVCTRAPVEGERVSPPPSRPVARGADSMCLPSYRAPVVRTSPAALAL